MPTVFLSHTSIDKPFVEKLAKDLEQLGIRVWFDKYQIKVGESILWKIDEGIRESEYLAIVISKEAWESEWVKTEVSAAWQKQVERKGSFVLPIYYRECEIPLFLRGIKYADFRKNYETGLRDLVNVFGIRDIDTITSDNWRKFARGRRQQWKSFREAEFKELVTEVCDIADEFHFSVWTGGTKNPFSFCASTWIRQGASLRLAVRMDPSKNYRYFAAQTKEINPNNVERNAFQREIGCTVNEVKEFLYEQMDKFTAQFGRQEKKPEHFTYRFINKEQQVQIIRESIRELYWDQKTERPKG